MVGNGDVIDAEGALRMFRETGCDAVMIGRGALRRPWIFRQAAALLRTGTAPPDPPAAADRLYIRPTGGFRPNCCSLLRPDAG